MEQAELHLEAPLQETLLAYMQSLRIEKTDKVQVRRVLRQEPFCFVNFASISSRFRVVFKSISSRCRVHFKSVLVIFASFSSRFRVAPFPPTGPDKSCGWQMCMDYGQLVSGDTFVVSGLSASRSQQYSCECECEF